MIRSCKETVYQKIIQYAENVKLDNKEKERMRSSNRILDALHMEPEDPPAFPPYTLLYCSVGSGTGPLKLHGIVE